MIRYDIFGLILLVSCLCTAVYAMQPDNSTSVNSTDTDGISEQFYLSNESTTALANLYLNDLEVISHTYGYLLTGNETQKQRLIKLQTDSDGSINGYLDILDLTVADNPQALKDYNLIYDAWDNMNASITQVISSYEINGSPDKDDLATFEQAAINLTDTFDTFIGEYYDVRKNEEKLIRLFMFADLYGAVNSQAAYDLSDNPLHKKAFTQKITELEQKIEQYQNLHPDLSIEEIKEMKTSLETFVTKEFKILDEGKKLSKEELEELTVIINKINTGLEKLLSE